MAEDVTVVAGDGVPLAVRDHGGAGPDLLLLHGLGEHLLAVSALASALTDSCRVLAADLRWSGRSGSAPAFDWRLLDEDVDAVLRHFSAAGAVVAGHSLGGIVAIRHGASHPDAAGVVNLDGWGFGDPGLYDGLSHEEAAATIDALREKVDPLRAFPRHGDAGWAASTRALLRRPLAARGLADDDAERWLDRTVVELEAEPGVWRIRPDPVLYDAMREDADVFGLLDRTRCRVLVVTSDPEAAIDPVVAARRRGVARRLADLAPGHPELRVTTVPGSSHESLLAGDVAAVAAAIRSFVAAGRSAG